MTPPVKKESQLSKLWFWLFRPDRRIMRYWYKVRRGAHWVWSRFGWGWFGHAKDNLKYAITSPQRQQIKAYCKLYGTDRKSAKKQDRRARMKVSELAKMRRAAREAYKQGRQPVFRELGEQRPR